MIALPLLATLSDDQLLAETKRLVANERAATAALLRSLMEIDSRRLYLREGCSSLFTYCTQVLHLAEGAAYNRIEAARAARSCPVVLAALAEGSVTLTSIRLLARHFTQDNCCELLDAARHKSKREVELLVATLQPKPPVATMIRRLPVPSPVQAKPRVDEESRKSTPQTETADRPLVPERAAAPRPSAASVEPLSHAHYKLQVTISHDTIDKLRRAQDLLRHTIPNGDLAAVLDRAVTLLLADLERRRCAATPAPRSAPRSEASVRSRHIPAAVRREVWRRDDGRCAFVGASGRCRETGFLEYHHVVPYADDGPPTAGNIELRCRAHNAYEAQRWFGSTEDEVRETSPLETKSLGEIPDL